MKITRRQLRKLITEQMKDGMFQRIEDLDPENLKVPAGYQNPYKMGPPGGLNPDEITLDNTRVTELDYLGKTYGFKLVFDVLTMAGKYEVEPNNFPVVQLIKNLQNALRNPGKFLKIYETSGAPVMVTTERFFDLYNERRNLNKAKRVDASSNLQFSMTDSDDVRYFESNYPDEDFSYLYDSSSITVDYDIYEDADPFGKLNRVFFVFPDSRMQ